VRRAIPLRVRCTSATPASSTVHRLAGRDHPRGTPHRTPGDPTCRQHRAASTRCPSGTLVTHRRRHQETCSRSTPIDLAPMPTGSRNARTAPPGSRQLSPSTSVWLSGGPVAGRVRAPGHPPWLL
jgi:hypothetical protein